MEAPKWRQGSLITGSMVGIERPEWDSAAVAGGCDLRGSWKSPTSLSKAGDVQRLLVQFVALLAAFSIPLGKPYDGLCAPPDLP